MKDEAAVRKARFGFRDPYDHGVCVSVIFIRRTTINDWISRHLKRQFGESADGNIFYYVSTLFRFERRFRIVDGDAIFEC